MAEAHAPMNNMKIKLEQEDVTTDNGIKEIYYRDPAVIIKTKEVNNIFNARDLAQTSFYIEPAW